ncbi:TetR/AcrR family transcriptional regulator C-terminal domain-containing protein [Streptomyces sp. SID3343]|uniref:TetR/AcrR family transcriptional regulator n=1 Tax=Streptomyces sp. SID3343 TaxID=2690260 RepID=UPI00136E180A|nr:TetR/AcrR family transcriptional regulator C-terminal domain-containing protein [Streptomyces sp. SID3343]MYW02231.1 TetR family transcriptional regulator [Streptomyces sp. SID3343]
MRSKQPVTRARIIEAAVLLTAEVGLEGWTIRSLAARLDSWPQVLYHHVGDRDAVAHAVVEEVVARFPLPDPELPWRPWFRELLLGARPVLREYRGVARRLALHGPTVPSALPIIDHGVALLARSGLGDEALAGYTFLLSGALSSIAIDDDRARLGVTPEMGDLTPHLHAGGEGLRAFGAALVRLEAGPDARETYAGYIHIYTIDRALDGIGARIAELTGDAGP